jgi:hypothetical protein
MTVAVGEGIRLSVVGGIGIACQGAVSHGDGGAVSKAVVGKGVGCGGGGNGAQALCDAIVAVGNGGLGHIKTQNRLLPFGDKRQFVGIIPSP